MNDPSILSPGDGMDAIGAERVVPPLFPFGFTVTLRPVAMPRVPGGALPSAGRSGR
jgi:hypothetical protein